MSIEVPELIERALNEAQGSSDKAVSHTKIDELKEKLWQYKNAGKSTVIKVWNLWSGPNFLELFKGKVYIC